MRSGLKANFMILLAFYSSVTILKETFDIRSTLDLALGAQKTTNGLRSNFHISLNFYSFVSLRTTSVSIPPIAHTECTAAINPTLRKHLHCSLSVYMVDR